MRSIFLPPLLASTLATAAPAADRALPVPAGVGWQHALTSLILRAKIAGYSRVGLHDSGEDELDVVAQYQDAQNPDEILTIFLFRPAIANVPIWFERSQVQIETRDIYKGVTPTHPIPSFFIAPGAKTAGSMRQSYTPEAGNYRSTALALIPVRNWLVSIRLSSTTMDTSALDQKLGDVISAIGWPIDMGDAPAAASVPPCERPLEYKKARLLPPSMIDSLLGAAGAIGPTKEDESTDNALPRYCRDGDNRPLFSVYRDTNRPDAAYIMALGDAGRVIQVEPSLRGLMMEQPGFAVSMQDLAQTLIYPSFDKLPKPEQVLELVNKRAPTSAARDGDITIAQP